MESIPDTETSKDIRDLVAEARSLINRSRNWSAVGGTSG
jgi:hypothetical protein